MTLILSCRDDNDLLAVLKDNRFDVHHVTDAEAALNAATRGDGLLLLADPSPEADNIPIDPAIYAAAADRGVRLYIECPVALPGYNIGAPQETTWERVVVASAAFTPDLQRRRILTIHSTPVLTLSATEEGAGRPEVHLVLARVAGFDTAVYGLPDAVTPLLLEDRHRPWLIACAPLSRFVTGRYAPTEAWSAVWRRIIGWLSPACRVGRLHFTPTVRPSFPPGATLPADVELTALQRGIAWYASARLFIHPTWQAEAQHRLDTFPDGTGPGPDRGWPVGDGTLGMIEGAGSRIHPDGTQDWRYHVRYDCVGEAAMAMAAAGALLGDTGARDIATNLNEHIFDHSIAAQGPRADPESPSYGLISWASQPPADGVYYGDDNARLMLATMASSAFLNSQRWTAPLLRCLLANLRTTGPLGFRGWRLDEAKLQTQGWRTFWEEERLHYAPHYEAWLWACFLWAYRQTHLSPFLERASEGIRRTMAAYPAAWRWTNGLQQERARMLLPLAWLVHLADTPEHRSWLRRIADDLLSRQDPSGAICEELGPAGLGAYAPPQTNEAYGTSEAPLIQENGDPLSDLLYTTNFAFVGLHEAAAATGEPRYSRAADRLADALCRIQVRSDAHSELDGGWFRAFDVRRWEYWASNADEGWGAWSIESGWTQGWITTVLALRRMGTSLWALTQDIHVADRLPALLPVMLPDETAG